MKLTEMNKEQLDTEHTGSKAVLLEINNVINDYISRDLSPPEYLYLTASFFSKRLSFINSIIKKNQA